MQDVTGLGHHTFVETLAGAAAEIGDVRLAGLVADLRAPLRVGSRAVPAPAVEPSPGHCAARA